MKAAAIEQRLEALRATDDDVAGEMCRHVRYGETEPLYIFRSRRGTQHNLMCCRPCAVRLLEVADEAARLRIDERADNVVPLSRTVQVSVPAPPLGQRHAQSVYEDAPAPIWLQVAAAFLVTVMLLAAVAAVVTVWDQATPAGTHIPTGLGGRDR